MAERSFSKLKLLKTYLRAAMAQERLNDLGMLAIEREISYSIELETLVVAFARFAKMKARKCFNQKK